MLRRLSRKERAQNLLWSSKRIVKVTRWMYTGKLDTCVNEGFPLEHSRGTAGQ